jgi:hypothetical protein
MLEDVGEGIWRVGLGKICVGSVLGSSFREEGKGRGEGGNGNEEEEMKK